ncbi:MAG: hypothetical protein SO029_09335, partial [Sodaliphilus sp.]|nr:hypothetical protein [Sodaliphilus sp.]
LLEIRHATALTAGAKHWHRQKAIFLCFCFSPPQYLSTEPLFQIFSAFKTASAKNGCGAHIFGT